MVGLLPILFDYIQEREREWGREREKEAFVEFIFFVDYPFWLCSTFFFLNEICVKFSLLTSNTS